ncbi:MAG: gliding motility-associated C-terminal domain-containing protein, partial [Flavobacteriales bacterium]|nr:gliding motility-associated C-terminal domain-containing protein [Flavobacteriales bacterium]
YGVTVTDNNGCQLIDSAIVIEPAVLILAVSETDIACAGIGNGTATVAPSGGTPNYSYLWSDGQTTLTAVGLSGGSISVDVLDSKGCAASIATSISENFAITSIDTSIDATLGQSNGQGSVEVSGGVAPYSYLWSDGQTSSVATGLLGGTYTVEIDDNVGCSVTDTVIVKVAMIEAATAFTPNSDGTNDVWTIGDMTLYPNVEVIVLGRWGQTIFSSIGYDEPWDGTYQGQELPMGSYFFIIDLKEGSDPVTGSVTIMK